jgi:hypothetical protein
MADIVADPALVAACGLYCGACKKYLGGKCPGCAKNEKATWCKVRSCCAEKDLANCGACAEHPDPRTCRTHDNFIARVIGLVLRSDRAACVDRIHAIGTEAFAAEMAARRAMTIRR